ncbi:MAG: hypothetical protein B6I20_05245 [Bacteroidetes bacterium 4572_117]|nr:MAG: hypothetical protein B6I20_05245 [Bacteroidetes bacterium 4572_117]
MADTNIQFNKIIELCREIFVTKMKDYGTAWRVLRTSSLTDQIFIKAQRIRSIETKEEMKVDEGSRSEFIGIVNYALMALIQLELGYSQEIDKQEATVLDYYNKYANEALELMKRKNHDYDEAWRSMRISSYTDLILMKLYRTKQIEDNSGKTLISEGIDANYFDMINYAVFALIKLEFG